MKTSVNRIRCGAMHYPVRWPTHQNKIIQDMGWHFAWMGGAETRKVKADSFAHAFDSFKWMEDIRGYSEYSKLDESLMEEGPAPDGNNTHILKRFPVDKLPAFAFEDPEIREFLLPTTKLDKDFQFNKCNCFWCQKLKFPLMYNLDGKRNWFEIPRSCSVTVKETFPDRKQVFRDTDEYDDARGRPLVVYSDPVERFVSCINAYVTEKQRYYHYGEDIFSTFGVDLSKCTKQEKIDYFFANLHKIGSAHQLHHFHPQAWFIDINKFVGFTVIKKHGVCSHFGITQKLNQTKKEITADDFSKEQIAFIKKVYQIDYDFYEKYGNEGS